MTTYSIPLQKVPAQKVAVVLDGQNCVITLRQIGGRQYLSLASNSVVICQNVLLVNRSNIVRASYLGFRGELRVEDVKADEPPEYHGWGDRWLLLYDVA